MSNSAAIARLQSLFGNVDKDVLAAVLDVCGGDAKAAAQYLQATSDTPGGGYDARQLQNNEGIPSDYPATKKAGTWQAYSTYQYGPASTVATAQGPFASFYDKDKSKEQKKGMEEGAATVSEVDRVRNLFLGENVSLQEHFDTLKNKSQMYKAVLLLLIHQGVEISKACRPRVLAAAWAKGDHELTDILLCKEEVFTLPAILGGVQLLDAARKIRSLEKKLALMQRQGTAKTKKLGALKNQISDLKREAHIGSVSGALARHVQRWARRLATHKLEFYALNMPKEPWQQLADIIHFNPKDFQCDWFLPYVFGTAAPKDSVVSLCANLTSANCVDILTKCNIPYSYLRMQVKPIPEQAKPIIASYSPIDSIVWFHEELACAEVDKILSERLDKEVVTFGYGKLMERLMYFKSIKASFYHKLIPYAEKRLQSIKLQLESPVVVLGDASYSMDVAIRTATVIGSVLTAVCNAELKFFTDRLVDPPFTPKTVSEVIDIATGVKADGMTAPAAALWEYYSQKRVIKYFIIVTDEVENVKYKNYYFPTLFQKYYNEVYPAKLVFVSFLENPSEKGRMVAALENLGIVPMQFKLDGKRPDLTKLDSLLGLLAADSSSFGKQVDTVVNELSSSSLSSVLSSRFSTSFGTALETLKKSTGSLSSSLSGSAGIASSSTTSASSASSSSSSSSSSSTASSSSSNSMNNNSTSSKAQADETSKSKEEPTSEDVDALIAAEKEKHSLKENVPESVTGSASATATLESSTDWVKVENKAADAECVICEEKRADTALVECGHMLFCSQCAAKLKECPVCRQKVVKCIRIYQ